MPYGSGRIIQQSLMHASPWQRSLIGVAMIAGGTVLVLLGHVTGGLLAIAGLLLLWSMVRLRLRRSRTASGSTPAGRRS